MNGNLEDEEGGEDELTVYPNPSTGAFTIRLREADRYDVSQVRLFDGMGKLVCSQVMTGPMLDLNEELPAGVYTVRVLYEGHEHAGRMVITAR